MVLMFEWILKFRIWVLIVIIGTYVYGILVIDGYLCSPVYSIYYSLIEYRSCAKDRQIAKFKFCQYQITPILGHFTSFFHTVSDKKLGEVWGRG